MGGGGYLVKVYIDRAGSRVWETFLGQGSEVHPDGC